MISNEEAQRNVELHFQSLKGAMKKLENERIAACLLNVTKRETQAVEVQYAESLVEALRCCADEMTGGEKGLFGIDCQTRQR